jgi:hypothetical protein
MAQPGRAAPWWALTPILGRIVTTRWAASIRRLGATTSVSRPLIHRPTHAGALYRAGVLVNVRSRPATRCTSHRGDAPCRNGVRKVMKDIDRLPR